MKMTRTLIVVAILCVTSLALRYVHRSEDIHPEKPFSEFPTVIGTWSGSIDRFDEAVYKVLGVDDSILSHFHDKSVNYVQLYIGFHQSQREGDLIHSPKNCMPGGGWKIVKTNLVDLAIASRRPQHVKVIQLVLQNGLRKQMVLYWYHSRGRVISSEYLQKIYLVIDSITRHRTDGSFVRLISPITGDEAETLALLKDFATDLFPILDDYIPS
ncbi:exosortase C-terminal domain/associated protein EpsI [uncultured Desulfosarcina sp.]|uniref:exosortase C-terminal domain/associated protein EpsI n=1 Tax=uncultured Desulfosarcina sp. TaxID=218289 RepID=UPI0029C8CEE6|nr:exosortase C-terminal domain/associated protein EpsI [uncultured Desulfosarcina sp.]